MSGLRLLHADPRLVVVDKPAGLPVIPGRGEEAGPSVRELLEAQLGRRVWVVHRLDRDTTGVLVFALDADAHRALNLAFEGSKVHKRYLALVTGRLEGPRTVDVPLVPARRGRMRPARPGEEGKPSITRLSPVEHLPGATLVEAEPLTGRTHQIRVHLRTVGHPLLVDHQYGEPGPWRGGVLARTPLHAARLELPATGGLPALTLEAPLPDDMEAALRGLREEAAT
ncbi:MAG: RNA pseudouridine synthase [Myxococcaceae bacterium]|nr:RNA pseudouridine synthase [Myxococcaceae bacterium]MCI0669730.1 RNA pseudouridine synthase [Myxococcaceae bacterium]